MVLRRLNGASQNTAPVVTLITQFGGGKTHTLASLYHLANAGPSASCFPGVADLLTEEGVFQAPFAHVGVFVGNAWDPTAGRETPWIDIAHQVAGDKGVEALGFSSQTTPPGTDALTRMIAAAEAPVLLLFDEVLNFVNRHRAMAEGFHAFIQNLTVAITGTTHAAAVISLPRSQVEMTDWDQQWQERITKVVRRVAHDLIANDESEISEVVRRRLFEDLGSKRVRKRVAKIYADWCFDRNARLPSEWLTVDSAATEAKAREFLRSRFEACYPFHPATLSVFQRKWRALAQFQQTRGALAMLAQWISWASRKQFQEARKEPLITLGSAPLAVPEFRAVVLGQLGEARLDAAIEADLAGPMAHANALDLDAEGSLRDIHRRVGTAILFESSGGQVDKVAHLPELRFALGEREIDTATIDNAASALEASSFFIRRVGMDGFRIHHQATLKKVVSDRRASLDEETEIKPAVCKFIEDEFKRGTTLPLVLFPRDSVAVQDSPRLALVVLAPDMEWLDGNQVVEFVGQWTKERGNSPRLYPGALIWCTKKPGQNLHEKVEIWLAWQRVAREVAEGILGPEFDHTERAEIQTHVREAAEVAKDEVWASYRFVVLADTKGEHGLKVIDLGAGHASASETLCGRVINALKSEALLNETVGAGYIERQWPPALKDSGIWPLVSLRQSFLTGALTRLIDPDAILRRKIVEFVSKGEFGLASGSTKEGDFERLWYAVPIHAEEVAFEKDVFLLTRAKANQLQDTGNSIHPQPEPEPDPEIVSEIESEPDSEFSQTSPKTTLRLAGTVPPEVWNRLGYKIVPKLRSGDDLRMNIDFSVNIKSQFAENLEMDLQQILRDLKLNEQVRIERS